MARPKLHAERGRNCRAPPDPKISLRTVTGGDGVRNKLVLFTNSKNIEYRKDT
jgi:hypothetical protein